MNSLDKNPSANITISDMEKMSNLFNTYTKTLGTKEHPNYDIKDIDEAEELIMEMYNTFKCRPVISVDKKYEKGIDEKGIERQMGKPEGLGGMMVGTFGIEPYLGNDNERVLYQINVNEKRINPRFTGKDGAFHGVVYISGNRIMPESLKKIGNIEKHELSMLSTEIKNMIKKNRTAVKMVS